MSLYTDIEEVTFSNDKEEGNGYQIVKRVEEGELSYLELCKGKDSDYPLTLQSHQEIDIFCNMLHAMLGKNKIKDKTKNNDTT